jgi:serine/threonine-protein kinase
MNRTKPTRAYRSTGVRKLTRFGATCAAALLVSTGAVADVSPTDAAAARALFDEGRQLVAQGKAFEACPKFEESQKLDPGMGTLFNLGDCYERIGRTASAWATFLQVATQAKAAAQSERESVARKRADSLAPKLSKLAIVVPSESEVQGLQVSRDGVVIGRGTWGSAVPVDPGVHSVVATAPGHKRWSATVKISQEGGQERVTVPALEPGEGAMPVPVPVPVPAAAASAQAPPPKGPAAPPPKPPEPAKPPSSGKTQRVIGFVVGGAGLATVGIGTYFGIRSRGKLDDSKKFCDGEECWDQAGVDLRHDAVQSQTTGWVLGGIGGALLIGGLVTVLTAPSPKTATGSAASPPSLALGPGGASMRFAW